MNCKEYMRSFSGWYVIAVRNIWLFKSLGGTTIIVPDITAKIYYESIDIDNPYKSLHRNSGQKLQWFAMADFLLLLKEEYSVEL